MNRCVPGEGIQHVVGWNQEAAAGALMNFVDDLWRVDH